MQPGLPVSSLSIVLPCFNEEASLERTVRAAVRVGRRVTSDLEVLVVDDGSRDRTAAIARRLSIELPELRLLQHRGNEGYGAALATGFREASKEYVFYTDADGQFDLDELPAVLPLLRDNDVISGYRRHRRDGVYRTANGWLFTSLVNAVFGLSVRDVNCAFKIYPRRLFERAELKSRGAMIDAECLALSRKLGLRVAQPAVSHFPRTGGRATGAKLRVMARAGVELFALARRVRSSSIGRLPGELPDRPSDEILIGAGS